MPTYEFVCNKCKKTFASFMSVAEMEKGKELCPHCKSSNTQLKPTAFFAKTARKS
jgi:putative FmdB family regulatory protein